MLFLKSMEDAVTTYSTDFWYIDFTILYKNSPLTIDYDETHNSDGVKLMMDIMYKSNQFS